MSRKSPSRRQSQPQFTFDKAIRQGRAVGEGAACEAVISGAQEAVFGLKGYIDGEISGTRYVKNVAGASCRSAASYVAHRGTEAVIREGAKSLGRQLGCSGLRSLAKSNAVTNIATGVLEIGGDAVRLARGEISGKEFGTGCAEATGSAAGAYGGAAIGTLICPGIGTVIGGMIGGMGGRCFGGAIGRFLLG